MKTITLEDNFIKLSTPTIEDWRSGKLKTQEFNVLLYLMSRASIKTGIINIDYEVISRETGDLFEKNDNPVNQVNKVMLSLKKKQRIWFERHPGSRGNIDVEIQHFPLKNQRYIDISDRFQQSYGRGDSESSLPEREKPAELLPSEQRLKDIKNDKDKLIKQMDINNDSRGPQIDKIEYRKIDEFPVKKERETHKEALDSLEETMRKCGLKH